MANKIAFLFIILLICLVFQSCPKKNSEKKNTVQYGKEGASIIVLDNDALEKSGIAAIPLQSLIHRQELEAYGTILQIQNLSDLYDRFLTTKSQLEDARIKLSLSQKEYQREKEIAGTNPDMISKKNLEISEAAWQTDKINVQSMENTLQIIEGTARQQWGGVIAQWILHNSPELDRLMRQQRFLIQATVPEGSIVPSPETAYIRVGEKKIVLKFISNAPVADRRIQGFSIFYTAELNGTGLLPGMNVTVYISGDTELNGFYIPDSSVVWYQDAAWVYVRQNGSFLRRKISTSVSLDDGYFVSGGFSRNDMIVTEGAQILLSEELNPQINGGNSKGDED